MQKMQITSWVEKKEKERQSLSEINQTLEEKKVTISRSWWNWSKLFRELLTSYPNDVTHTFLVFIFAPPNRTRPTSTWIKFFSPKSNCVTSLGKLINFFCIKRSKNLKRKRPRNDSGGQFYQQLIAFFFFWVEVTRPILAEAIFSRDLKVRVETSSSQSQTPSKVFTNNLAHPM
jgi:hypothetical protein